MFIGVMANMVNIGYFVGRSRKKNKNHLSNLSFLTDRHYDYGNSEGVKN